MFHAHSIWLFTWSDLKTILIPATLFGILNRVAISLNAGDSSVSSCLEGFIRLPLVVFWVWVNLCPFNIDNQRRDIAILEDEINKPWRTMPSRRMTPQEARTLMLCLYALALFVSLGLGGVRQCLALMLLGYSYNEAKLADRSWVSRNGVNALGFCCFTSGALEVALGTTLKYGTTGHEQIFKWLGIISAVVFSTVQMQDMADQEGDRIRQRKTMPLAVGDFTTRWMTAAWMMLWSTICPQFWSLGFKTMFAFGGLGSFVACRTLAFRSVAADKRTFVLWNMWMAFLYSLPLLGAMA